MKTHFTDLSVRSLRPVAKQTKVWDTGTRGFGVLVSGSTKSWFVCYGTQRRLQTLGRYPTVTSRGHLRHDCQALHPRRPAVGRGFRP